MAMNTIKDTAFLIIFLILVIQNVIILIKVLFEPPRLKNIEWLSFPSERSRKLRKALYCLYPILLFIILFYLRLG